MKLRLAKKILKGGRLYTRHQRDLSAIRVCHWARGHNDALYLRALQAWPECFVVADDAMDLDRERLEGIAQRKVRGISEPAPLPEEPPRPVYRKDGQVHSFEALPWPGMDRRHNLTRKRYDARYAGARPAPSRTSGG